MPEAKTKKSEKFKTKNNLKGGKDFKVKRWQKPILEDVSERIMAQPYIRFT